MVRHEALIDALRRCGYTFKRQTDRVQIYKKRGSTHRVALRRSHSCSPEYARKLLRSAGMDEAELEAFISEVDQ